MAGPARGVRALAERRRPACALSRDGTQDRIFAAAHTAADAAGDLDWLVAADSGLMRVHPHGATARRLGGNAATVSVGHGCRVLR